MTLGEKLSKIQQELKVAKSRYNKFGKYNYRSAEDILEALKPMNEKYKVFFTITEELVDGQTVMSTACIHDAERVDGVDLTMQIDACIKASAIVGVEKAGGMALPQAYGSASSYGKKYALGNLLLIDDTADADATNTHGKAKAAAKGNTNAATSLTDLF